MTRQDDDHDHRHDGQESPVIELLSFAGCPNHTLFLPHLRQLLADHHIPSPVQLIQIPDDQTAQQQRFLGSPSLRVDGQDVEPGADARSDYGLQCRVYNTSNGLAGTPPDVWIRAALRALHPAGPNPPHETRSSEQLFPGWGAEQDGSRRS